MIEPEFPEDRAAYDSAGNYLGDVEIKAATGPPPFTVIQNKILDIKIVQQDRAATMPGYRLVTFDEMEADPSAKQWLIKGILARGETSAWIAPPGAMKSALLAQAAICVGAGLDWHGHRNKGAAGVVYFAIERADLVKRRLRAHRQRLGLKGTPICVSSDTIDLTPPGSLQKSNRHDQDRKDDPGRRYRAGHHRHVR